MKENTTQGVDINGSRETVRLGFQEAKQAFTSEATKKNKALLFIQHIRKVSNNCNVNTN